MDGICLVKRTKRTVRVFALILRLSLHYRLDGFSKYVAHVRRLASKYDERHTSFKENYSMKILHFRPVRGRHPLDSPWHSVHCSLRPGEYIGSS